MIISPEYRKTLIDFHGDACPLSLLGARMGLAAMNYFNDYEPRRKLIVITDNHACIVDGISFATTCTVGTGSIFPMDYGKHGAVFYHKHADRAIRIRLLPELEDEFVEMGREVIKDILAGGRFGKPTAGKKKFIQRFMELPDDQLLDIQHVELVQRIRAPTPKQFLLHKGFIVDRIRCSSCNEYVEQTNAISKDGKMICIPCTGQGLYRSTRP